MAPLTLTAEASEELAVWAEGNEVKMRPDYVGFEIPDEFVVGYGLDYRDLYRNLPYLAALEESDLVEHK